MDWTKDAHLTRSSYLVGLTIAPAFLSASIYLCLSRIIVAHGRSVSRFRPAIYTIAFICFDLFSLILQAAGGAIAASSDSSDPNSSAQTGINIMIAGLCFQVVSLFLFMAMCADFAFAVSRHRSMLDPAYATLRSTTKFKAFLVGMLLDILIENCSDHYSSGVRGNPFHFHSVLLPGGRAEAGL